MKRFLVNLRSIWNVPIGDGCVINASGIHIHKAVRRDLPEIEPGQYLLFDPQLYLSALDGGTCAGTCFRLMTYPWFGVTVPDFESGEMLQKDWFETVKTNCAWNPNLPQNPQDVLDVVRGCLEFQVNLGATHLIAPAPLVEVAEDQFTTQLLWLEAALRLKGSFAQPILFTLAINDYLLSGLDPLDNTLLQVIIDHLTVSEIHGIYIVPVQQPLETMRITDGKVAESIFLICNMAARHQKESIVNFADDFGFACLGAGASCFASGTRTKERRMCLQDFVDRGGGLPHPRFYSHGLIGDFLTKSDMEKIAAANLLRLMNSDVTPGAIPLFDALRAGAKTDAIPTWKQTPNNVTESSKHRITLLQEKARQLGAQVGNEADATLIWLQEAEAHAALLTSRFVGDPLKEDLRHIAVWSEAFEHFGHGR